MHGCRQTLGASLRVVGKGGRAQFLELRFSNINSSLEKGTPMTGFLDNTEIEVPCPKCGRKTKQRIGRLNQNPTLTCAGCGTVIKIDTGGQSGLAQATKTIDKSMADLERALKKFGK